MEKKVADTHVDPCSEQRRPQDTWPGERMVHMVHMMVHHDYHGPQLAQREEGEKIDCVAPGGRGRTCKVRRLAERQI